ncbi:MAG: hypothetical protein V1894_02560 [Chloroflexota bacterium]
MGILRKAAFTAMRLSWLIEALILQEAVLPFIRDSGLRLECESKVAADWMLFYGADNLPADVKARAVSLGLIQVILLLFLLGSDILLPLWRGLLHRWGI